MAAKDSTRIVPAQPSPRLHKGDAILSLTEMVERHIPSTPRDPFLGRIHDELIGLVRDRIEKVFAEPKTPLSVDEVLVRVRQRGDVQ